MSEKLYDMLTEGTDREIPWHKAAEHFVMLKVASGGVLPEELDELDVLRKTAEPISREELLKARKQGLLSGIRGSARGDVARSAMIRRKRGERVSKAVGAGAGAGIGALLSKKHRAAGAAIGAALGYTGGKAVGEEVDRKRIHRAYKAKPKKAAMEKASDFDEMGKEGASPEERKDKSRHMVGGAAAGAAAGGGIGALLHRKRLKNAVKAMAEGTADKQVQSTLEQALPTPKKGFKTPKVDISKHMETAKKNLGSTKTKALQTALLGLGAGALGGAALYKIRQKLKQKSLEKAGAAPEEQAPSLPVEGAVEQPAASPGVAPEPPPSAGGGPMEEFLKAQQAVNEAEFFKQKADEAAAAASQAQETNQVLEDQLQQTQSMQQQQEQQRAMQDEATQQQAQMSQQQAEMASQDAMQAREQSLAAQQQNIGMRQAITNYRQALMDLIAQDPTQAMAPPMAPEGPMPPGPGGPAGPPPPEAGGPPPGGPPPEGAPPGGPPPEGGPGGPPPGGPPPGGPPPGAAGPPPGGPPPGPPPGGPPAGPPPGPPPGGPPAA